MKRAGENEVRQAVLGFVTSYGLLGFMTALREKPVILWDFHSLLLGIQIMLSFMLVDDGKPLRCCKHCQSAFAAGHPSAVFCSPRCKNQFNVYKNRGK